MRWRAGVRVCVCVCVHACVGMHIGIYRDPSAVPGLCGFLRPVSPVTCLCVLRRPHLLGRKVSGGEGRKTEGARDGEKPARIPEVLCNRSSGVIT